MRNMMILILVLCFAVPSAKKDVVSAKVEIPVVVEPDVPVVDEHEGGTINKLESCRINRKPQAKLFRKLRLRKK